MKKIFIWIIPKLPDWFLNWLIQLSQKWVKPIDSDPNIFLQRSYKNPLNLELGITGMEDWQEFQVGSCKGIYFVENKTYNIVAVQNTKKGNGHFQKVLKWFEKSAQRDGYSVTFLQTLNPRLGNHLLSLGYMQQDNNFKKSFTHIPKGI